MMNSQTTTSEPQRAGWWSTLVLLGYWLVLFTGTHLPAGPDSVPVPVSDKFIHFSIYGGLAVISYYWLRSRGWTWPRILILLWGGLALHGIVDELTQAPIPGRSPDPWDVVADVAGISAGLCIARLIDWWLSEGRPGTRAG